MKFVLAVSGGIDSVVLLDLMVKAGQPALVAHFDHGIRDDSAADARFVEALASKHGLEFETKREDLGADANEQLARDRRYDFLHQIADKHEARLVTAHHQGDVVETVALNIARGGRWRGLGGMNDQRIARPLLDWTKQQIRDYATRHQLEWCEDETNQDQRYKRNSVRSLLNRNLNSDQQARVYQLWKQQNLLRPEIDQEVSNWQKQMTSRYFLTHIDPMVAKELLYYFVRYRTGISLLGPQLDRLLLAIKTGRAGTVWQIGGGIVVKLTTRDATIDRVD